MQTSAISAPSGSNRSSGQRGLNALKSEDFFRIMVTELRQQDPFEPTKTSDMIGQVSQIRDIELTHQLGDTLAQVAQAQRTAGVGDLIGKYVGAVLTDAEGTQTAASGVVTGVQLADDGTPLLELDSGQIIPSGAVVWVTTVEEAERRAAQGAAPDATNTADKSAATARARRDQRPTWWQALERIFQI